jgi:hypothetical protein
MPTRSKVKTVNRKKSAKKRTSKKKATSRRARKVRKNPELSFEWEDSSTDEMRSYDVRVPSEKDGVDLFGSVYMDEANVGDPLSAWEFQVKEIPSDMMTSDAHHVEGTILHHGVEKSLARSKSEVRGFIRERLLDRDDFPPELATSSLEGASWVAKKTPYQPKGTKGYAIELPNLTEMVGAYIELQPNQPAYFEVIALPHGEQIGKGIKSASVTSLAEAKEQAEAAIADYLGIQRGASEKQAPPPPRESVQARQRAAESKDPAIAEFFRSFKDEPVDTSEAFLEDILRRKDRGDIDYWPNPKKKGRGKKKAAKKRTASRRTAKRRARKNPYGVEEFRTDLDHNNYKIEYDNGDVVYFNEFGQQHRIDGPAAIYADGHEEYWINGKRFYDKESFEEEAGWGNWQSIGSTPTSSSSVKKTSLPGGGFKEIRPDGTFYFDVDGLLHREGAPAVENADGSWSWWLHGKVHREGGPAIKEADGLRSYWIHGKAHREDGPAIEHSDGHREWWLDGKEYTEEGYKKEMKRRRGDLPASLKEEAPAPKAPSEWEKQKAKMAKREAEIWGAHMADLGVDVSEDPWEKFKDPLDNPRKKKRRAKKKAAKNPKKGSARELVATCRKHWEAYCERPTKTNLRKVFKHFETMAESTAKSVKDEMRKCRRAARAEAKDIGLKL